MMKLHMIGAHPELKGALEYNKRNKEKEENSPSKASVTKKVRKVDIGYAMRTFLIFEYTFGTHLSQKVHISSTMDNYYGYEHEIRLYYRLLEISHVQLGET